MFDVVIPVGPDDINIIHEQLKYTTKNVIGYRNIYLVLSEPTYNLPDNVYVVLESAFPFQKTDVEKLHGKWGRNGWYFQQLLKLYAGTVIPGILGQYLVLDSDTFLLNPVRFVSDDMAADNSTAPVCLYATGTENHTPYFDHLKRLHPCLEKQLPQYSGICHHMMFETVYVQELFALVETYHENQEFWRVFLEQVDNYYRGQHGPCYSSGASEYEMYFNFMLLFHPGRIQIRPLRWKNAHTIQETDAECFDYVSCHYYMR